MKHTFDLAHHERIIGLDSQSAEHLVARDDHHATLNHQPLHNVEHPLFRRDSVTPHRDPSIQVSMIPEPARPFQLMSLELAGEVKIAYDPGGVVCKVNVPLADERDADGGKLRK